MCLEWTRLDLYTATLTTDKPSFTLSMLTTLLDLVATGNQRGKLALADNSDALWLEIGSDRWLLSLEGPQVGSSIGNTYTILTMCTHKLLL